MANFPSAKPNGDDPTFTTLTEGQVGKADADGKLIYSGATVSTVDGQWTFDESINVPGASVSIGTNITLSDFGEILASKNNATNINQLIVTGDEAAVDGITPPKIATSPPEELLAEQTVDTDTSVVFSDASPLGLPGDISAFTSSVPSDEFLLLSNTLNFATIPGSGQVRSQVFIGTDDTGHKIFDGIFDVSVGLTLFAPPNPQVFRVNNTYFSKVTPVNGGTFTLRGLQVGPDFIPQQRLLGYPIQRSEAVTRNTAGSTQHDYLKLGDVNEAVSAKSGGIVQTYLPTATSDTITAGTFIPGVVATSNPTVVTDTSAVFSQDDLVQIIGSNFNDGLYEVESHVSTLLKMRGVGTVGTVEDFTKDNFFHAVDTATITKVNVSVLRADLSGDWEQGKGSETPIVFSGFASVFGSEFEEFSSLPQSSTTSSSFISKLSVTTASKPAGTYRITLNAQATNSKGDKATEVEFEIDGVAQHDHSNGGDYLTAIAKEDNQWSTYFIEVYKTIGSPATIDLDINFRKDDKTARISDARISIWRVS